MSPGATIGDMSVSIYYEARRHHRLTPEEQRAVEEIISTHSVDADIQRYLETGVGPNWEPFCVYDASEPSEADVVFEGATKLPDDSQDAIWVGVQHWCRVLTEIRRALPGADWDVHVDDHRISWNEELSEFDPTA